MPSRFGITASAKRGIPPLPVIPRIVFDWADDTARGADVHINYPSPDALPRVAPSAGAETGLWDDGLQVWPASNVDPLPAQQRTSDRVVNRHHVLNILPWRPGVDIDTNYNSGVGTFADIHDPPALTSNEGAEWLMGFKFDSLPTPGAAYGLIGDYWDWGFQVVVWFDGITPKLGMVAFAYTQYSSPSSPYTSAVPVLLKTDYVLDTNPHVLIMRVNGPDDTFLSMDNGQPIPWSGYTEGVRGSVVQNSATVVYYDSSVVSGSGLPAWWSSMPTPLDNDMSSIATGSEVLSPQTLPLTELGGVTPDGTMPQYGDSARWESVYGVWQLLTNEERAGVQAHYLSRFTPIFSDVYPPSTPRNFAGVASAGSVALSWDVPSNPGSPALNSYQIYRKQVAPTPSAYTLIGTTPSLAYTDMGLPTDNAYYMYKVQAVSSVASGDGAECGVRGVALTFDATAYPGYAEDYDSRRLDLMTIEGGNKVTAIESVSGSGRTLSLANVLDHTSFPVFHGLGWGPSYVIGSHQAWRLDSSDWELLEAEFSAQSVTKFTMYGITMPWPSTNNVSNQSIFSLSDTEASDPEGRRSPVFSAGYRGDYESSSDAFGSSWVSQNPVSLPVGKQMPFVAWASGSYPDDRLGTGVLTSSLRKQSNAFNPADFTAQEPFVTPGPAGEVTRYTINGTHNGTSHGVGGGFFLGRVLVYFEEHTQEQAEAIALGLLADWDLALGGQPGRPVIQGVVTDGGVPVQGATVTLQSHGFGVSRGSAVTNAQGEYSFMADDGSGTWSTPTEDLFITITASGYPTWYVLQSGVTAFTSTSDWFQIQAGNTYQFDASIAQDSPVALSTMITDGWFDASDNASITLISGGVDSVADQNGGTAFTAADPGSRPTAGTIGSLGALNFDGTSQYLQRTLASPLNEGDGVVMVLRPAVGGYWDAGVPMDKDGGRLVTGVPMVLYTGDRTHFAIGETIPGSIATPNDLPNARPYLAGATTAVLVAMVDPGLQIRFAIYANGEMHTIRGGVSGVGTSVSQVMVGRTHPNSDILLWYTGLIGEGAVIHGANGGATPIADETLLGIVKALVTKWGIS